MSSTVRVLDFLLCVRQMDPMNENMDGGKKSSWMKLVMKVKKSNPKLSLGQAMKKAKTMYKKTRRGGGGPLTPALVGGAVTLSPAATGGRRRGSRKGTKKTRRHRKY